MEEKFNIGNAVSYGWEQFKENVGFYILIVLIMGIAAAIPDGLAQIGAYSNSVGLAVAFGIIFGIIGLVVSFFVNMAYVKVGLTACDQKPVDYEDLYSSYPRFWDYLLGSLLYCLIVLGGLILLIIPGIYWAIKYHFYGYLIIDQGMGPVDAIRKSGQITRGSWWHLFLFFLAMMGIIWLGFLACCVGILVAAPVVLVSTAYVYRFLLAASGTTALKPPVEFAAPPPAVPPAGPPA